MCLNPILIDNPYKGLKNIGLNRYHDCTSKFIPVPCGNCSQCIALRQMYIVQRCHMQALNNHLFMCTLTYNNEMLKIVDINGYSYSYAFWPDLTNMFKRLRKSGYKFSYFAVNEYGSLRHRPHFHFILSLPKTKLSNHDLLYEARTLESLWYNLILSEWRRNIGSTRSPIYKPLFTYKSTSKGANYDFHYIDPSSTDTGEADVAFYVSKYLLKSDPWLTKVKSALKLNLSPEDFSLYWKLLKQKCCISKHWGLSDNSSVYEWIRKGIDFSIKDNSQFPYFISPYSGKSQPLSPYYQKKYLTISDAEQFYFNKSPVNIDVIHDSDYIDLSQVRSLINHFEKVRFIRGIHDIQVQDFLDYDLSENFTNLEEVQENYSDSSFYSCWSNSDFEGMSDFED